LRPVIVLALESFVNAAGGAANWPSENPTQRKTRARVGRCSFLARIFHPLIPVGFSWRTTVHWSRPPIIARLRAISHEKPGLIAGHSVARPCTFRDIVGSTFIFNIFSVSTLHRSSD